MGGSGLFILLGLIAGESMIAHRQSHKTPYEFQYLQERFQRRAA